MSDAIALNAYDESPSEVIFVPGWGLGTNLWTLVQAALVQRMPGLTCMTMELGNTTPLLPVKGRHRLVVGHSTGFLWLLQQRPFSWDSLVAVNGFTRFVAGTDFPQGVKAHVLQQMLYRFEYNPTAVVTAFLRRCGVQERKTIDSQWLCLLQQGLMWLRDWDARSAFSAEQAPLLVLAGGVDPIVPPAMTKACFRERNDLETIWQPVGGHLLPLSHPEWLAMHIQKFIYRLYDGGNIHKSDSLTASEGTH
ncbi:Biotin synthesis protein BioH [invertebrate metagenome]|uniref:Biotin synthesis protein BioH n=1 Tax=invertebrate metagenome TaxID=1711999 RepID=A0A484H8E7_9ZZZZ